MLAYDVGKYLSNLLSPEQLAENLTYTPMKEDGLRSGDDSVEVKGVLVCWMATSAAINYAIENDCNVIICHENPFFNTIISPPELEGTSLANRNRMKLLAEHNIALYRCHSPIDVAYIADAALNALNLPVISLYSEWIARVATIPPMPIKELAGRCREGFKIDNLRLIGDASRIVSRVGISAGGMGLSINGFFQEWLRMRGAELIITGEFDDYTAFWAAESDVSFIAVTHPACENPGLIEFADRMRQDFPCLSVHFYECRCPIGHKYV